MVIHNIIMVLTKIYLAIKLPSCLQTTVGSLPSREVEQTPTTLSINMDLLLFLCDVQSTTLHCTHTADSQQHKSDFI